MSVSHPAVRADGWQVLLDRLDPIPSRAARLFSSARAKLIELLRWRGCRDPEWVTDEAFSRTARHLADGVGLRGDALAYVTAVARLVALEEGRRGARHLELVHDPAAEIPEPADQARRDALEACLDELPDDDRALLLDYHAGRGIERIERRARIAARLGVQVGALRTRTHRLRSRLATAVRTQLAKIEQS